MAAAGFAVSLLTQGVGEVVISGTWRQRDIQTWKEEEEVTGKKKADISTLADLSYVPWPLMTVFYVSFWASACHQNPSLRPRNIQMSQSSGTLRALWKCQRYSGLCEWTHDVMQACMYISNRLQAKTPQLHSAPLCYLGILCFPLIFTK